MKKHLAVGDFDDCSCALLDLRRARLFVADSIPANIAPMISSEIAWVDNFFEQAAKAA
jgi:hypothetical protein